MVTPDKVAPGLSDFCIVFIFGKDLKSLVGRPQLSSHMSKKCQGPCPALPFLSTNFLLTHAGQPASAQSLEPATVHAYWSATGMLFGLVNS